MFCSKCGKEIEKDMQFCNNCGNKVDISSSTKKSNSSSSVKKIVRIGLIVFLSLITISIVVTLSSAVKPKNISKENIVSVSNETIINCAQNEVSKILKSSATAYWGNSKIIDKDDYERYLVYVPLEAQNGFGGYNKLYYLVIIKDVKVNGEYRALKYGSILEIPNYAGATIPSAITEYNNGNVVNIVKDFLDNNNWGQEETNVNT